MFPIEIKSRSSVAWEILRRYCSQLYDLLKAKPSLKTRLLGAQVVEGMLDECATSTLRREDLESLHAHYKLSLQVVGFLKNDRSRHKPLLYVAVLKITQCVRSEMTIRKRRPWFAGAFVLQDDSRLPGSSLYSDG